MSATPRGKSVVCYGGPGWAGLAWAVFSFIISRKSLGGFHGWFHRCFLFLGHFHLGKMAPPLTPKFASYYSREQLS